MRLAGPFTVGDNGTRRALLVFGAALSLIWLYVHVSLAGYLAEDSYIHFRVAEHLLEFGRPFFNRGEAVKTSTSTPWTLLLALIFRISPRPALVSAVSALISLAGAALFVSLHQRVARRRLAFAEVGVLALIYLSLTQIASVEAMETPLALLLALAGLHAFYRADPRCFLCLGAAACTRIELCWLLVPSAAVVVWLRMQPLKRAALWLLAGAGPFSLYDLAVYGTVWPHAAVAKSIIHRFDFAATYAQSLPEALLRVLPWSGTLAVGAGITYVALGTWPLLTREWSWSSRQEPTVQLMVLSALSGLGIAGTYLLSHGLIFAWYRPLYFTFLLLPSSLSVVQRGLLRGYALLLFVLAPFLWDFTNTVHAAFGHPELASQFLEGARARKAMRVAAELYREYPNADLVTAEIGAIGYAFPGHLIDAVGIATPASLVYHPLAVPSERHDTADAPIPRQLVRDARPGIIMAVDEHLVATLHDPVRSDYVHIRHPLYLPEDEARRDRDDLLWRSVRYLDVLVRRDLWQARHPEPSASAERP